MNLKDLKMNNIVLSISCQFYYLGKQYYQTVIEMIPSFSNTQPLKLLETDIHSTVNCSRNFKLQTEIQHFNKTLQKSIIVQSKLKKLDQQLRQKATVIEKSISNSLSMSQQRRNRYLSQKQKQMSLHSKKVKEKLLGYQTAQKKQYKKAAANQRKFSQTISEYWMKKTIQDQVKEKKIYNKYKKSQQKMKRNKSQQPVLDISHDEARFSQHPIRQQNNEIQKDKGLEVRNRMHDQDQQKQDKNFQKIMRKLSRIQRKNKVKNMRSCKTQNIENQQKRSYDIEYKQSPRHLKSKANPNKNQIPLNSLVFQRRKLPCYYLQNLKARKNIQQQMFDEHSRYLQNYRNRVQYMNSLKQAKNKLTQKKMMAQRWQKRSQSH